MTSVPMASCNVMQMASHNQEIHAVPHFSCHNLRNAMVPLMMLLASCDTDVSAIEIKQPESHVTPYLNCLDLRNAIGNTIGTTQCQCCTNSVT